MDKYLTLTTTTEQPLANKTCAMLENAGIPVMMEHVELKEGRARSSGYRVLVPSQFTQVAMKLADATSMSFYTCKTPCRCDVCTTI